MDGALKEGVGENRSKTDVQDNQGSNRGFGKEGDPDKVRVLSVDKVTVEKIVLESSNGSREVFLTKNESSRKLSINSEPGVLRRSKDERSSSTVNKFRVSVPEDAFTSKLPISKIRKNDIASGKSFDKRIRPIKLTKSPSIRSITVAGLKSAGVKKVPPKVPKKPGKFLKISKEDLREKIPKKEEGVIDERSRETVSISNSHHDLENDQAQGLSKTGRHLEEGAICETSTETIPVPNSHHDLEIKDHDPSEKWETETAINERTKETISVPTSPQDSEIDQQAQNLLEKSQSNIQVLQQNLSTRINPSTAERYKEALLGLQATRLLKPASDSKEKIVPEISFDQDFLEKHNLDRRLKIEENRLLETDLDYASDSDDRATAIKKPVRPRYSKKVSEVEKRWSGEFLESRLDRHSSSSSYVEELESVSSRESVVLEDNSVDFQEERPDFDSVADGTPAVEDSVISTLGSDSCLEERIKSVDSDAEAAKEDAADETDDAGDQSKPVPESGKVFGINNNLVEAPVAADPKRPLRRTRSTRDGYARLIREFNMEPGSSRTKKEEKPKKKGFRRLLPGFFSPKDSRKDYKKKEAKERKRQEERHFARYQQNGNYTRSPDTMNLNEDIKRNVKLDNSLNGSIIEERLNEIKRELFPDNQGPITTSTPDHMADADNLARAAPRSYTINSSLSSIAPDDRWIERHVAPSDPRKYERQKLQELESRRYGQLERKHSLQEANRRPCFFQRNHAPSGRISAPPGERYLVRPRAIHPVDRPLPAIPSSRIALVAYENYLDEQEELDGYGEGYPGEKDYENQQGLYENEGGPGLVLRSVSAQVKITRQPIVNQNQRAPLVGRSPKYSPGSSQKSGDYADSSCTPNSSQKSEFSPSSSKSGEYYLHSPRSRSPEDRREGIYQNESQTSTSRSSSRVDDRIYKSNENCSPGLRNESRCNQSFPGRPAVKGSPRRVLEKGQDGESQNSLSPVSGSPGKVGTTSPASSSGTRGSTSRRSQPGDQILIASPKRDIGFEARIPRPSNESRCRAIESPVPMTNSPHRVSGVTPLELRSQNVYGGEEFGGQKTVKLAPGQGSSSQGLAKDLPRPEPIYGHRKQQVVCQRTVCSAEKKGENLDGSQEAVSRRQVEERIAWVQASSPRDLQIKKNEQPAVKEGRPVATQSGPQRQNQVQLDSDYESRQRQPKQQQQRQQQQSIDDLVYVHKSPTHQITGTHQPESKYEQRQTQQQKQQQQQLQQKQQQQSLQQQQRSADDLAYIQRLPGKQVSETQLQESNYEQRQPQQQQRRQQQRQQQRSVDDLDYVQRLPPQQLPDTQLQESNYDRSQQKQQQQQQQRSIDDLVYVQKVPEPVYGQRCTGSGPLSPSKRETRQHLEAFYWQQKALEAHRKSVTTPATPNARQTGGKIDLPEVREAVYWQQLKKLDEEQQRRIYEQNTMGEFVRQGSCNKIGFNNPILRQPARNPTSDLSISTGYGDPSYWEKLHRSKGNPTGKPPLMQTQKGPNQPVLIVRPQQQARERREMIQNPLDLRDLPRQEMQRSKSASPHFHAMNFRKTENQSVCDEGPDDGKPAPPPIFKRGSLISTESVEYGTTAGPKRVSFSSQSNTGQDLATAKWPTKRGPAPEPPTRRHRSEDSTSDTDSVFSHQERRDPGQEPYGNPSLCLRIGAETEYDADRPLPPIPKDSAVLPRPENGPARWNAAGDGAASSRNWRVVPGENEARKMAQQNLEEEWNPDGKGRQPNDIGGSGRGEGEPGSNELTPGRRGGGGLGVGGSVLGVGIGSAGGGSGGRATSGGGRSRDEPRRHTLGGDHQPSLHHQQFNAGQQLHPLHPHHLPPPHGQYGTPPTRHTTMDLEMGTKSRQRKSPLMRGYQPPSSNMLFDDDPGIMSEVETSSTGFRRGGKQRSSLPVVRTPSKTLERPLGLVFLQYRSETKRALLPNEITSIDTVKALFVRSFPKQLTMEYLDSPHVKVYIHDSNKDMFYELEDLRSHLRDIRDRSVLRLFESSDGVTGMPGPLGLPGTGSGLPPHWEDQSYFSEPEFDSEYQHQHIHKSKTAKNSTSGNSGYYVGGSSTLPRGGPLLRAYSPATSSVVAGPNATPTQPKALTTPGGGGVPPAKPLRSYQCGKSPLGSLGGSARFSRDSSVSLYSIPDRLHGESGYMSSPERGGGVGSGSGRYPPGPYSAGSSYEDPYYSQYSGTVTPVIDEEASDTELLEESYSLYGVKPPGRPPSGPPRSPFPPGAPPPLPGQSYDVTRIRVEHMERQLANLTGLVQKALTHGPHPSPSPRDYLQVPAGRDPYVRSTGAGDEFDKHSSSSSASLPVSQPAVTDDSYLRTDVKPPKLGKDKSVSFEKSVSFSDEPPDMNSPKQHSPQHAADTKPTKPAIKSSTLPRMSSQERDRHKPTPPPKPAALVAGQYVYRDLALTPEMYNQLRGLQKKAKDLRQEVRNLMRMSQEQAHTVRETIRDTFITIRAMLLSGGDTAWSTGDAEKTRLSREEDLYKQEMIRLEKDLIELESTVDELRGNVLHGKTRVNLSDVENMGLILSKSSKTVADLKVRFPNLREGMKGLLSSEMEKVVREEKFLREEPARLESALRRCKKLSGTLVTLKRLASVQERLPNAASVDAEETPPVTPTSAQHSKAAAPVPAERTVVGSASVIGGGSQSHEPSAAHQQRPENALDALLDELQTFSRPSSQLGHVSGAGGTIVHQGSLDIGRAGLGRDPTGSSATVNAVGRAPCISDIGRKGSVDSSSGILSGGIGGLPGAPGPGGSSTLRRLHSYPSSSDTDTSPPIARLQVSLQEQPSLPVLPQGFLPGQKPPVPERNAELLQLATARRVPPPPPPRTSSRSPLASPTSPQLPPRNHSCNLQGNATLRRPAARGPVPGKEGKPPMALPPDATAIGQESMPGSAGGPAMHNSSSLQSSAVLSTSNSSSCESVNSQEGMQSKRGRQEQLEQRHQELLRKQKALQEQYARLQQLQRNAAGLTTVPPAPPDLLKKTGSESNLLAKMGLGLSTASSGSLTSLSIKPGANSQEVSGESQQNRPDEQNGQTVSATTAATTNSTPINNETGNNGQLSAAANATSTGVSTNTVTVNAPSASSSTTTATSTNTTTTSKIYETDIL